MKHLTPREAADLLQVNEVTIQRKCRAGEIPGATKAAGPWRIPEEGFRAWLATGQAREQPGVAIPHGTGTMSAQRRHKFRALAGGAR